MKRQNANYKTRSEAQQEEDAPWLMWEVIRAQKQLVCVGHVIMCLCLALNLESLSHEILVSEFSYKTVVSFASLASMRQDILTVSFTVRSRHC